MDSLKVKNSLLKKGFLESNTHHKVYEYYLDGKQILHTRISHGANHDISKSLICQMSKQCKLSKNEFLNLVNCPMSKEDYERKIRASGIDQ